MENATEILAAGASVSVFWMGVYVKLLRSDRTEYREAIKALSSAHNNLRQDIAVNYVTHARLTETIKPLHDDIQDLTKAINELTRTVIRVAAVNQIEHE